MKEYYLVVALLLIGSFFANSTASLLPNTLPERSRIFVDDFLREGSECKRGGPFDYPRCQPGTWCIGNDLPRCTRHRKAGETCTGPYEVCNRRTICGSAGICESLPTLDTHYVPLNGACEISDKGKSVARRCLPGIWCILGHCRKLVPCGDSCDLDWQVCRPGLRCNAIFRSRKRICTRASGSEEVLQEGDRCIVDGITRCKIGLVCASQGDLRTCANPRRIGMSCEPEAGMCEVGRVCARSRDPEKGHICSVLRHDGESCEDKYFTCKKGLKCKLNSNAESVCM